VSCDSCARDAIAKAQYPNPTLVENVMYGRVVDWVRWSAIESDAVCFFKPMHIGEMAIECLRLRNVRQDALAEFQYTMQEAAGSCGVDDKPNRDIEWMIVTGSMKKSATFVIGKSLQVHFVEVCSSETLCFPYKIRVEIGAVPVSVSDLIMGAGCDE
jgi:hypothetical protein